MSIRTRVILPLVAALATVTTIAGVVSPAHAATGTTRLPQEAAAQRAAHWLAGRFDASGFIPQSGGTGPDVSATANSILALSAADSDLGVARSALGYLAANVDSLVTADGADGPGQLALLILDAVSLGSDPTAFGGTDLVARLLATQQPSGPDAGLFGTETQLGAYDAGTYNQGLALTALAAAGVRHTAAVTSAIGWLTGQQCPDGGWTLPSRSLNSCDGTPAAYGGPDTNTTSLAVQGLVAEGALTPPVRTGALGFFATGQDTDAGWSYFPTTSTTPASSDPDSTSLVVQALVAAGASPTAPPFARTSATPLSTLLSFQLTTGDDAGAFFYPPAPAPGNVIATYEAVPALAGLPFPWGPSGRGYREVASDGGIFSFGDAAFFGSTGGTVLNKPIVGMAATPDGGGYWEVASDGGIFSFGDAAFFGSTGGTVLNKPIVGMAATPDGGGYWEVASDGGIFSFGDAAFFGSTGGTVLNKPIVGMAATPDGGGYWEVASDGGIFSFGDAAFFGSTGGTVLNKPIVGMAATPDGGGYWEVASDGGIFSFGDAAFFGSTGGTVLNKPIVGMAATPDGGGYWEVASDGGIFSFGDAAFFGSTGGTVLNKPIVGMAADPSRPV